MSRMSASVLHPSQDVPGIVKIDGKLRPKAEH
jgi:hypothetical protein